MKPLFCFFLLFIYTKSYSQLIADPGIEQVTFSNIAGIAIDDTLPLGYVAQLNVPITNSDPVNGLPAGSCKIKIGLGTKMILDPSFDLSTVNTSQYFEWTAAFTGGQVQITGDLKVPLPANFSEVARFNVQGSVLEYSTITTNFLVSNHNTQVILSDNDPTNNSSFRFYKIIPPILTPVNFTNLFADKKDCSIDVSFTTENEINVQQYDVEISKDGSLFSKAGSITAANLIHYKFNFAITTATASPVLYIRIRSLDRDRSFKYSMIKTINATCSEKTSLYVYPNPVKNEWNITARAKGGSLNGKYQAILYDAVGRLVSVKDYSFNNQQQFNYPVSNIAAGQYALKIIKAIDGSAVILKVQKL